jgi:hypothetical protein
MANKIENSNIQKFLRSELSFYITVGIALLAGAANYYGLTNQLALLSARVDNKAEQQAKIEVVLDSQQVLLNVLDKRITTLETRFNNK